jgi:D-glycero-alpha-D-manno-heptose-7-phosphate kinase
LASNVSNERVDDLYEVARRSGAIGGKLLGAGQAGFLMLFCPPSRQASVRERLKDLREMPFAFESEGSKIVYVGR